MLQAEHAPPRRLIAQEVMLYVTDTTTPSRMRRSPGDLCHFLGREFVCSIFTWPAGGSRGLFFGYNVDRESGSSPCITSNKPFASSDTPG
jgi:hypothetical protein